MARADLYNMFLILTESAMPPKEFCFKIKGVLIKEKDKAEEEFSMFITAIDDNHAVMLVREHLRKHAPKGNSVIKGIEKQSD